MPLHSRPAGRYLAGASLTSAAVGGQGGCLLVRPTLQWRTPAPACQKITFGEMRAGGVRGLLIYCRDYKCSHWTAISGDRWPDDVRLSDIEPRFTCQACGKRGANVRPNFDWEQETRGEALASAASRELYTRQVRL